jgi:hypothetical protein
MQIESNYGDLDAKNKELTRFGREFPTVINMMPRAVNFFKLNAMSIKDMQRKASALLEKYVEMDKVKKPVLTPEGKLNFKDAAQEPEFEAEFAQLMKTPCKIYL